jgi:hypothetical protein
VAERGQVCDFNFGSFQRARVPNGVRLLHEGVAKRSGLRRCAATIAGSGGAFNLCGRMLSACDRAKGEHATATNIHFGSESTEPDLRKQCRWLYLPDHGEILNGGENGPETKNAARGGIFGEAIGRA